MKRKRTWQNYAIDPNYSVQPIHFSAWSSPFKQLSLHLAGHKSQPAVDLLKLKFACWVNYLIV